MGKNRVGSADELCIQNRVSCADTLWVRIEWAVQIHCGTEWCGLCRYIVPTEEIGPCRYIVRIERCGLCK